MNKDGVPDTNRDLDRIPDYEEPFLMFDVEPNEYVYGLDRNNNDEPDRREDDGEVDYPYDYDERGFHLFGQWHLTEHWYLSVGHYDISEVAGVGRNRSTYGLVGYRRQGSGWLRRIFLENNSRRVQDDITPQYKLMLLRLQDQERNVRLRSELRSIPILRVEYALSPRTLLQAGDQGFGPLPYRKRDDTSDRRSFERSTLFLTLTNSTHYFGYDLRAIVGVARDELQYDGGFRDHRNVNVLEFFLRALVGFTEFGRPI